MRRPPQNQSLKLLRKARMEHVRQVARYGVPGMQPVALNAAQVQPVAVLPQAVRPMNEQRPVVSPQMDILIYQSEVARISELCRAYDGIETCWHLFGTSSPSGIPVVEYVQECGPDTVHEVAFCKPDMAYLAREGSRLVRRYGLCHIGEGHSHHRLGLNEPSDHDVRTTRDGMRKANLQRFVQMIVTYNDTSTRMNAFMFTKDGFRRLKLQVLLGTSPVRRMEERSL